MTVRCPSCESESPDWYDTCKTCGYDLTGSAFDHPQVDFRHNPHDYLLAIGNAAAVIVLGVIIVGSWLVVAAWQIYVGVSHGSSDEARFGVHVFCLGCMLAAVAYYSFRDMM